MRVLPSELKKSMTLINWRISLQYPIILILSFLKSEVQQFHTWLICFWHFPNIVHSYRTAPDISDEQHGGWHLSIRIGILLDEVLKGPELRPQLGIKTKQCSNMYLAYFSMDKWALIGWMGFYLGVHRIWMWCILAEVENHSLAWKWLLSQGHSGMIPPYIPRM